MANLVIAQNGLKTDILLHAQRAVDLWTGLTNEYPSHAGCLFNYNLAVITLKRLADREAGSCTSSIHDNKTRKQMNHDEASGGEQGSVYDHAVAEADIVEDETLKGGDTEMEDLQHGDYFNKACRNRKDEQFHPRNSIESLQDQVATLKNEKEDLMAEILKLQVENVAYKEAADVVRDLLKTLP